MFLAFRDCKIKQKCLHEIVVFSTFMIYALYLLV